MNELREVIEKIYSEELPPHFIELSETEKELLRSVNLYNISRSASEEDWEKLDDLIQDLRIASQKEGFIAGFSYALTFMEKVYGLDLSDILKEE